MSGQTVNLRVRREGGYDALGQHARALADHIAARAGEDPRALYERVEGTVCGTRSMARALIDAHPEIDVARQVALDAGGIEVASPPFLDELVLAWPRAYLVNGNEDVRASWDMVIERRFA